MSQYLLPDAKSSAIAVGIGSVNRLRVDIRGAAMVFYINNQPVGKYLAESPVQGFVGVGVIGGAKGAVILVNNIRVDQID